MSRQWSSEASVKCGICLLLMLLSMCLIIMFRPEDLKIRLYWLKELKRHSEHDSIEERWRLANFLVVNEFTQSCQPGPRDDPSRMPGWGDLTREDHQKMEDFCGQVS